jgi:DNA helicase-2/ATP-dependent DNA helicase PcrA
LKKTNEWLDRKIKNKEEEHLQLEKKLAILRKESGGSYSHELETAINEHYISSNILNGYMEIKPQPYFARIDFQETRGPLDSFYIGKIGLMDEESGYERVVDWRAPIADLYYSGLTQISLFVI